MRAGLHGERPWKTPAVAVEHRQCPQIDRVPGHAGVDGVGVGHQGRAPVMIDDALRVAGGARRVIERDRIPLVVRHRPLEGGIAAGQEFLVVDGADALALRIGRVGGIFGIVEVNDQRRDLGQRQRVLHDAGKFAVDDQHLCLGMVELEGDDGGIEPGVEGMQHRLDHRHAEMRFQHGRRVGQHHRHRVALADAFGRKRRGKPQRALPEIAVGDALAAMNDGDMVGEGPGGALQERQRRQRLVVGDVAVEAGVVDAWQVLPLKFEEETLDRRRATLKQYYFRIIRRRRLGSG